MLRQLVCLGAAVGLLNASAAARRPDRQAELIPLLERVGERVERFLTRAQRLLCIEIVHWQPLGMSLEADGFGRHVESELRVSWDRGTEAGRSAEAHTVRQVLKVNGRPPREHDRRNCTSPEQITTETQPLSMLLPSQRAEYRFTLGGKSTQDHRPAFVVDYRELKPARVTSVEIVDGNDECISFDIEGGSRGRIWIDADTFDVLRLDRGLAGYVEVPVPKSARRPGLPDYWTMTRMDQSIRFRAVAFEDPDEILVLPVSMSSLQFAQGAGIPRLRTTTEYKRYRRFLTGVRMTGH